MRFEELNVLIKDYIEDDKTGMAMMLTAPWGYGKSYYIQNTLVPFLLENKHKSVVVSLYGLKNIQEISKQIYLCLRTIRFWGNNEQKSEAKSTTKVVGKVIGKTIFNTIVSKVGLDVSKLEDGAFQEVYESVDLTGMLIVLEDLERSEISVVEILGYVNNLVEHDNVRVLLVANEDEL
ncbi:MAG: KAP family NTPase, partial [Lachnospiraceae bacterium]|nr:KAP family NTPase [Lachnospiraceae bacterium]